MSLTLLNPNPVRQTDATGAVCSGALLYTYAAGTTTPQPTYTDATGSTPLSNPVVADATGLFPQVWLSPVAYDLYCYTSSGTLLWQSKGIAPTSTNTGFTPLSVTGTDTIIGSFSPGISIYTTGQQFQFQAAGNNTTTAVSINISGLGPIPIYRAGANALAAGDIKSGQLVQIYYTGSYFQYLNPLHATLADVATLANTATVAIDAGYAGDIKHSVRTADHGKWLMSDGRTIGDGSSGGTARANADTLLLFTEIWNGSSNTDSPIQDSSGTPTTRGASAAADFAAHKRMPLPDFRGMVIKGTPNGGGNTTNPSRANLSYEADGNKSHSHTFAASSGAGATNQISSTASQAPGFVTTSTDGNAEATVRTRAANIFIYLG